MFNNQLPMIQPQLFPYGYNNNWLIQNMNQQYLNNIIPFNNNIPLNNNNIQYNNNNQINNNNIQINHENNSNNNNIQTNHENNSNNNNIQINLENNSNNNNIKLNHENQSTNNNIQNNHENQINNEIILNNNNFTLDKNRKDIFPENAKLFNIIETENEIFIANKAKFELIKILKDDANIIERITTQIQIPVNLSPISQADGIIGIFDLNGIKYLGIILSSEESATILNSKIYLIKSIKLIKISKKNEFQYNKELTNNICDLFSTGIFYYSNDYKLSLILNQHSQKENNSKYLFNFSLLKLFYQNSIPDYFYAQIILGFVSSKNNLKFENNQLLLDIIIIERYFYENIIISNNDIINIKQIEFISIFKSEDNNGENKPFSFVCYENSETINDINAFIPFRSVLLDELKQFQSVVCIINNLKKKLNLNN